MIKFKMIKTYSRIFASAFFTLTIILAFSVILISNNPFNYSASLTGSQATQNILSQNNDLIWWLSIIILFTLLGFFLGYLIDVKRSEYIKINGKDKAKQNNL